MRTSASFCNLPDQYRVAVTDAETHDSYLVAVQFDLTDDLSRVLHSTVGKDKDALLEV